MAQQTADPKLIDSMALRYRHDFGFLDEPQKEAIRTTMKQLWEEVVGLGFYKPTTQQTAVEWLFIQLYEKFEMKGDGAEMDKVLEQAKQMEKERIINAYNSYPQTIDINDNGDFKLLSGEQYYNETYGK